MDIPRGALVARVLPNTPAERSDIKVGDVIVKFNNQEVGTYTDLPLIVGTTKTGSKVPVEVIRSGRKTTLMVTVEELPENLAASQGDPGKDMQKIESNPLNVVVVEPSDEEREQLQIDNYGVVVQSLEEGPASEAGIRKGDVILLLDNEKVTDIKEFNRLIDKMPKNKSIPVLIQRRGNPTFLALKLEDE
jgi:serine protease Do